MTMFRSAECSTPTGGDGPRLGYLDSGPRTDVAIVLLHSLGADSGMWRGQLEALAADCRVIAPDSRGHGRSAGSGAVSVDDWVSDLDRVLDDAGVTRAVLVGVSLGGIQAIAYAAEHPDCVAALVIADSFVELDPEVARSKVAKLSEQARGDGMDEVATSYVRDTFIIEPQPDGADDVRKAIAGMGVDDYVAAVEACFGVRIAHCLSAITAPTLVLWGDHDHKTPRVLSERIASGIAGAELHEVPGAGHLSNVDNRAGFLNLLAPFVRERVAVAARQEVKEAN